MEVGDLKKALARRAPATSWSRSITPRAAAPSRATATTSLAGPPHTPSFPWNCGDDRLGQGPGL